MIARLQTWWGRDREWHEHQPLLSVRLMDGSVAPPGPVMRRRVRGVWQYRHMTDAEYSAHLDTWAL